MNMALVVLVLLGFALDFLNGIHESSNIVAPMISSRAIRPRWALIITAFAEFIGPLIFGVVVAGAIGKGVIQADVLNIRMIYAVLITTIFWALLTWQLGIPSSATHALLGSMIGAVFISHGIEGINVPGVLRILLFILISPMVGFLVTHLVTILIYLLAWKATPRINDVFNKLQILTSFGLALAYGSNGAQKTMGILTLGLLALGQIPSFKVPVWIIILCASAIALGTLTGGWSLIRTLGMKFYKIRPVHGLSSQLGSGAVIVAASLIGFPVSTTQVISSSIIGAGAADRMNQVRWAVAKEIILAWVVTMPASALIAAGVYWVLQLISV